MDQRFLLKGLQSQKLCTKELIWVSLVADERQVVFEIEYSSNINKLVHGLIYLIVGMPPTNNLRSDKQEKQSDQRESIPRRKKKKNVLYGHT